MKKIFILIIPIIFAMGSFSTLFAHKVNIFYYAEDNTMYLETYFSDGTKCRNSEIEVYDANDNKLILKGKTDLKGKFQFKIPEIPPNHSLKIVLIAEMGHRSEVTIKPSEWVEASSTEDSDNNVAKTPTNSSENKIAANKTSQLAQVDYKKIEKILDKKLKPVLRELALLRDHKPSFNEIFGGIGYIFGLFGIIFYFKAKK